MLSLVTTTIKASEPVLCYYMYFIILRAEQRNNPYQFNRVWIGPTEDENFETRTLIYTITPPRRFDVF